MRHLGIAAALMALAANGDSVLLLRDLEGRPARRSGELKPWRQGNEQRELQRSFRRRSRR